MNNPTKETQRVKIEQFINKYASAKKADIFKKELEELLFGIEEDTILKVIVLKENNDLSIVSRCSYLEIIGHLDMIKMAMRNKVINS